MKTEKLGMEHRALLDGLLKRAGTPVSEYSFANLYLFRKAHGYEVLTDGDVFVRGRTYDGFACVMPVQGIAATDLDTLKKTAGDADFVFPVPEAHLEFLRGKDFESTYNEGDSDYIYDIEKMAAYKGSRLHGKKNLLNQFLARYSAEGLPLTADRMKDAASVLDQWQEDVGEPREATDYFPCLEAFETYESLGLCGGIYMADGEPAGFIIGEELNGDTFALHFAKGKRKFKGMYQYMYNNFAKILPKKYKYFNFEQDMGKLALKIAKSSYYPDAMLKKMRVSFR